MVIVVFWIWYKIRNFFNLIRSIIMIELLTLLISSIHIALLLIVIIEHITLRDSRILIVWITLIWVVKLVYLVLSSKILQFWKINFMFFIRNARCSQILTCIRRDCKWATHTLHLEVILKPRNTIIHNHLLLSFQLIIFLWIFIGLIFSLFLLLLLLLIGKSSHFLTLISVVLEFIWRLFFLIKSLRILWILISFLA